MKIDMTISTLMKINMTLILYTLLITCPSCLWKTITILLTINDSDVQKYTYAMIYCCFWTSMSFSITIYFHIVKNFNNNDGHEELLSARFMKRNTIWLQVIRDQLVTSAQINQTLNDDWVHIWSAMVNDIRFIVVWCYHIVC